MRFSTDKKTPIVDKIEGTRTLYSVCAICSADHEHF